MNYSSTAVQLSTEVVVHPLVLLSVVDHYMRVAKDTKKRVVGVLLGSKSGNRVDITNSFAVPFEEDLNNPIVWFLDHNFLDTMFWMFKKVNTRENIVGFYSSGPKIKENDLKISAMFRQYCTHEPVFVIIDVRSGIQGIPTTAYEAIEEVESDGKEIHRAFKHVSCNIEAEEAEEVGVEHLLRDINDPSTSSLALQIQQRLNSLSALVSHLIEIRDYLQNVLDGRLPINNQISYNLQDIFNLLPNLNIEELVKSMLVKTNDIHLAVYLGSLVRSVIALHDLLNNKVKYKDLDQILDRSAGIEATSSSSSGAAAVKDKDSSSVPSTESKNSKFDNVGLWNILSNSDCRHFPGQQNTSYNSSLCSRRMNINKYDDNETFISGMEDTLPITLDSIPEESVLEDNIVVESDNMPIVKESQDISSYTSAPMQFDDGLENSEPQLQADNVSSHNIKSEEFNKKLMSDLDSDVSSESDKEGSDDEGVDIPYTPKAIMKSAIKYIAVEVYERYGREHVRNFMRDQLGLDPDKEYKWEYNAGGTYERKTQTAWEWDSESGTWKVKESVTKTKINGEKTVERYSAADADKNDAVMESVATGNTIGSDNTIDNDVEVKNVDNAVKESVAADSTSPEMFVNKVPAGSKECWKPECNQS